jgi:hypothetical protein
MFEGQPSTCQGDCGPKMRGYTFNMRLGYVIERGRKGLGHEKEEEAWAGPPLFQEIGYAKTWAF